MQDKIQVLYVDDEKEFLGIGKQFLERQGGFIVYGANDADEAINLLKGNQFDVIISDYLMPRIDGISFLKILKSEGNSTPFIFFTGRGREEIVIEALNNGADFYVQKEGDLQSQFEKISDIIRKIIFSRYADQELLESQKRISEIIRYLKQNLYFEEQSFIEDKKIFKEIFKLDEIQKIQDEFVKATGVASIITHPDGTLITKPGKFTRFCHDIIQNAEMRKSSNSKSPFFVENPGKGQPLIKSYLNGMISIAFICFFVENKHIANWIIGPVRNEISPKIPFSDYPLKTGKFEQSFLDLLYEVPLMPLEKFRAIIQSLFLFSTQFSKTASQNLQKCRLILNHKETEDELQKKNIELQVAYEQIKASELELRNNIDEILKQKMALKISEERLLMAQEISRIGAWEYDIKTDEIWGSAEALGIFGYPPVAGNFSLKDIESRIPDSDHVHQALIDLLTYGKEYNLVYEIHPADGSSPRYVHSVARLDKDNINTLRVIGYIHDITAQIRAEIAVVESEKKYRDIYENSVTGLFKTTPDGKIIQVNDALALLYGYSDATDMLFSAKTVYNLYFNSEDRNILQKILDTKGIIKNYEIIHRKKDGTDIWVSISARIIREDDGRAIFYEGSIIDITERKKIEDALNKSENLLKNLVKSIPDLVWLKDGNGVFLSCNSMFERLYGASQKEILGKTDYDFVNSELADFFRKNDLKAITEGRPISNEEWVTFADNGKRKLLETIKTPIFNNDGSLIGVLGIGRDITDRKRDELILKETNEAFTQAQKIARVGSWMFDLTTNIITWSDELFRIFGYEPRIISPTLDMIRPRIHPDDLERHDKILEDAIESGNYTPSEYRLVYPDHSIHYINANGTVEQDEDGNSIRLIGVCQDITSLKTAIFERDNLISDLGEANEELRATYEELLDTENELKDQYDALFESKEDLRQTKNFLDSLISIANVPIVVWDPALNIIKVNLAFELLLGKKAEELIGKPITIIFPESQRGRFLEYFDTSENNEEWKTIEIDIERADGSLRTIVWNSSTLYSQDGLNPVATIAQGQDITNQIRLEREKNQAILEIQQNLAQLSVLNDEIRNPLTIILTYAEFSDNSQIFECIKDQVKRIDDIVTHLDQRWNESEKVLNAIRKHYLIYSDSGAEEEGSKSQEILQPGKKINDKHIVIQKEIAIKREEDKNIDDISLALCEFIVFPQIQLLLRDLYSITGLLVAVLDLHGNILISEGWQDICTKFHRTNADTCKNCIESDTILTKNIPDGAYKLYKCKNNMWDISTPIYIEGIHIANLFMGQFFFDDEDIDYSFFKKQAERYGFDKNSYMKALEKVPRYNRKTVDNIMQFYIRFIHQIIKININNVNLSRKIQERDTLLSFIQENQEKFRRYINSAPDGVFIANDTGYYLEVNPAACEITGYSESELLEMQIMDLLPPESYDFGKKHLQQVYDEGRSSTEFFLRTKDGRLKFCSIYGIMISQTRSIGFVRDISDKKRAEESLLESQEIYQSLVENAPVGIISCDKKGNITYFNMKGLEFFESICDKKVKEINLLSFLSSFNNSLSDVLIQVMKTGVAVSSFKFEYKFKSGKQVDFICHISPIIKSNVISGAHIVLVNISDIS